MPKGAGKPSIFSETVLLRIFWDLCVDNLRSRLCLCQWDGLLVSGRRICIAPR